MKIRNFIVQLFGIKKSELKKDTEGLNNQTFNVGEKMLGFRILDKTDNEIIFGKVDKHLNFRSSFLINNNSKDSVKKINLAFKLKHELPFERNQADRLFQIPLLLIIFTDYPHKKHMLRTNIQL